MTEEKNKMMKEEAHWHYTGVENRRRGERRDGKDRRDMIRFELDKEDRRSGKDRREKATDWGSDKPL